MSKTSPRLSSLIADLKSAARSAGVRASLLLRTSSAASLAVNLRMAMYSASLVAHLGPARLWQRALVAYLNVDQTYALVERARDLDDTDFRDAVRRARAARRTPATSAARSAWASVSSPALTLLIISSRLTISPS